MHPTRLRVECSAPKGQCLSSTIRVKHETYLVVVHESLVSGRGHIEIGPSLLVVACGSAPLGSVSILPNPHGYSFRCLPFLFLFDPCCYYVYGLSSMLWCINNRRSGNLSGIHKITSACIDNAPDFWEHEMTFPSTVIYTYPYYQPRS
jgi:hypothetical protein